MHPEARAAFNNEFTAQKYERFLAAVSKQATAPVTFRVAETPVFLTADLAAKLVKAGTDIIETIIRPDFKDLTKNAIPARWNIPNENDHPHFIALDFGICLAENGELIPKLIEMQGFPSLYGFQLLLGDEYRANFEIDQDEWTMFFSGLNKGSYLDLLKETILGRYQPDEVILMDVSAHQQKTNVDFYVTSQHLGIAVVALEDLIQQGNKLYYKAGNQLKQVKRIYNRLIFDEIENDTELLSRVVDLCQPLDVEWVTHPNWFYRISKYTMPFLKGDYIPKTWFLNEVDSTTLQLENYVLKPLFSFAGQGVIIDVAQTDIDAIADKENWILQQKVVYQPAVKAPDGGVKAEIRLLYLWPDGHEKPTLSINLARLSRGKMIGVRYNKDFDWVGGTVSFLPK
jgi:hypothetical protein